MNINSIKIINRPLAPHLSIYKSQITSTYSIWHRFSGILISLFLFLMVLVLKFFPFILMIKLNIILNNYLKLLYNIIFLNYVIIFYYHLLNGIRHIIWDLGYTLQIFKVIVSSKIITLVIIILIILMLINIIT